MIYYRLTKWQKKKSLWQKMAVKKFAYVKKKQYLCSRIQNKIKNNCLTK